MFVMQPDQPESMEKVGNATKNGNRKKWEKEKKQMEIKLVSIELIVCMGLHIIYVYRFIK